MLDIVLSGGWLMVPIILCSVIVVAISIERYWTLNPSRIAPRHLLAQVWGWIKNNQLDGNKIRELKRSSELGKILAAGLSNSRSGREVMKDSIEEAAGQVVHDMERYVGALGTVAAIAPLFGLLGTVWGMIKVFNGFRIQEDVEILAVGISEALITTAAGLCVAIPALIFNRYFQRRIDTLVVTMEQEAVKLVDALHSDRRVDVRAD